MAEILFWAALGALVWVYVGYPFAVALLARGPWGRLHPTDPPPTVTVAIAVHDEVRHIAERIQDVLLQDSAGLRLVEVLVGSDGSTDGTDELVRQIVRSDGRVRLLALPRRGTTSTQHALIEAARGDVVVLTDAETRFARGCLRALVEPFRDPRVGCATGRLEWQGVDATATSQNEGLYWRYERRVRALESRAGALTALTGAILAVRRSSYRPVRTTTGMDHLLPLLIRGQGQLVTYVPDAVAVDRPITGLREQFRNRTRTATRGIGANLSMVRSISPWRDPRGALAMWSHKLLRWATPWFVAALALAGALLAWRGQTLYGAAPASVLAGCIAAVAAHLISGTGRRPPRALAFARAFAVVNLAFAIAWLNVLQGRRIEAWHRAEFEARTSARP